MSLQISLSETIAQERWDYGEYVVIRSRRHIKSVRLSILRRSHINLCAMMIR